MTWTVKVNIDSDKVGDAKNEAATVSATFDYEDGNFFVFSERTDKGDISGDSGFIKRAIKSKTDYDNKTAQETKYAVSIENELNAASGAK